MVPRADAGGGFTRISECDDRSLRPAAPMALTSPDIS